MLTVHLYDPNDFFWRKYFPKRSQPGIVFTSVSNLRDIQSELRRIGGLGGKIDVLWIHSHGSRRGRDSEDGRSDGRRVGKEW